MKILLASAVVAGSLCAPLLVPEDSATSSPNSPNAHNAQSPQDPQDPKAAQDAMAKMMAKAKRFTQPGKHHKVLQRFIGKWNTETRIFMGGKSSAEKGTAEHRWLMDGRWLQMNSTGKMMGRSVTSFWLMGYNNFKQSFVATGVSDWDTSMNHSEGDLDKTGKTMLLYGTIDEYLTGEHDKMVKTVFRFESKDKIIMELHDLPIGEHNTKVVEIVYTRKN